MAKGREVGIEALARRNEEAKQEIKGESFGAARPGGPQEYSKFLKKPVEEYTDEDIEALEKKARLPYYMKKILQEKVLYDKTQAQLAREHNKGLSTVARYMRKDEVRELIGIYQGRQLLDGRRKLKHLVPSALRVFELVLETAGAKNAKDITPEQRKAAEMVLKGTGVYSEHSKQDTNIKIELPMEASADFGKERNVTED